MREIFMSLILWTPHSHSFMILSFLFYYYLQQLLKVDTVIIRTLYQLTL